ncbi:PAS domain S-box-containing protein [Rhodoligotrophos appendicifer]|uniref:hybrid sensor histidine kinase/response regulator n=1 Tax=Rhodoligotrophos appendicifer TaxID=987056 RepID=UPI002482CB91|nr:PAS domain-containing sensor histidine kinase [Rhodoligotrophos appendicifer]
MAYSVACGKAQMRLPELRGCMPTKRIEDLDTARRLQLLVDSVVDYAIYMISLDGNVVSWNSGAMRLKGYQAAEIIGRPYSSFFTPEDQEQQVPQRALEAARKVGRFEAEGWRIRKDGARFWALAVIDAVRDESGELIGFAKVTRDMTEREEARRRLVDSEAQYRQLVGAVIDYAIFQIDPSGQIVTWNQGAQRIKGYSPEEIIGQHFSCFYSDDDQAAGLPTKALESASREGRYEAEGWRVRKDGTKFWALVVLDRITSEAGELIGFAKITRDITERMEAQKLLRATEERLAVSQKMEAVGQLSGGIAHDFNNLLMIVFGNLETAQRKARGVSDSNLDRAISNAMRGAQRAAALTSRLLAFSRRQALDPKPLDVNRFLTGTADFLQRSLGEMIDMEVVGSAGLWRIEADVSHLESALVNLAINARDAMPGGGKITIEATNVFADESYCRANPEVSPGQFVLICVSDTGSGMTPEVADRVFEPFFTTKEVGQGTGLGLSQVYGFVKQSGGHVKIYSEVDQGTTVKIYFPRYSPAAEMEEEVPAEAVADAEKGEVILLVEDDPDLRSYLMEVLLTLGYQVIAKPDGQSALAVLEQTSRRIDLLLTDVVMPGMNGRELAKRAAELRPALRILYMTGYSRNAVVHHGRLDEGVHLLQKPVTQSQLATKIRTLLDQQAGTG